MKKYFHIVHTYLPIYLIPYYYIMNGMQRYMRKVQSNKT
jgi:hypothetical protein